MHEFHTVGLPWALLQDSLWTFPHLTKACSVARPLSDEALKNLSKDQKAPEKRTHTHSSTGSISHKFTLSSRPSSAVSCSNKKMPSSQFDKIRKKHLDLWHISCVCQ